VIDNRWCHSDTKKVFDFDNEDLPEPADKEKKLTMFLSEFQKYIVG